MIKAGAEYEIRFSNLAQGEKIQLMACVFGCYEVDINTFVMVYIGPFTFTSWFLFG